MTRAMSPTDPRVEVRFVGDRELDEIVRELLGEPGPADEEEIPIVATEWDVEEGMVDLLGVRADGVRIRLSMQRLGYRRTDHFEHYSTVVMKCPTEALTAHQRLRIARARREDEVAASLPRASLIPAPQEPFAEMLDRLLPYSVTLGLNYTLVWEAFADTKSNPRPDVIAELLRLFDIGDPWKAIDAKTGGKGEILRTFLDTFIETRNRCAHTGSNASPPSSQEIREDIDRILLLGNALVEVLEDRLGQL